jgi:hypothetical protein
MLAVRKMSYNMKQIFIFLVFLFASSFLYAQQNDWTDVEKVFGKKGTVQDGILKVTFPRSDLKVTVGNFTVAPGLALTGWAAFMKMGDQATVMGDMVLLDKEVGPVVSKIVANGLQVTAIHNHLLGEIPAVKYLHFSGRGPGTKLAESLKSVLGATATPMGQASAQSQSNTPDWSKVEAVLGKGKANGNILTYGLPRAEKLMDSGMEVPPFMGTANGVNFQMSGNEAAIAGDFVLIADEVNPVVKALTENGIVVTAIHNHMLYDDPRLFMLHFWAVNNPEKLAKGIKAALDKINLKK